MKKSLQEALNRAKAMSIEHPDIEYDVMDKRGCRACVHSDIGLHIQKAIDGYVTVARFKGGEELQ